MFNLDINHLNDKKSIFKVNKSSLENRWDPQQFHIERAQELFKLRSCSTKKLKNLFYSKSIQVTESDEPYVGLENIESGTGVYIGPTGKTIFSSAKKFKKGDVLFPKLRPYLNKVYLAEFDGVCSTEFYVFDSKSLIINDFLAVYLRSNLIVNQTKYLMTGNTLPRLQTEDVNNLQVPNISHHVQDLIVDKYKNATDLRSKRLMKVQSVLASIDIYLLEKLGIILPKQDQQLYSRIFVRNYTEVMKSRWDCYFHQEHFIDFHEELNNGIYPVSSLKNLSTKITSGITPKSGGDAYVSSDEGIPFIRSGDINIDGNLDYSNLLYLKEETHNKEMKSSQLQKNDLLIAIVGATIGQVGIYLDDGEANINQAIALVRLKDELNPFFFKELIKSSIGQWNLNHLKRPVARANINLEEISTMRLIVPPIEVQNEIVEHIQQIRDEAKKLEDEANLVLDKAKQEIEKIILGEAV